jgi:5-methyltetrahydrofolate--homocysteine methyltransferase
VSELYQQGLEFPVLVGGAAINRDFGLRILYPNGDASADMYTPGVFYCKDAFEGLDTMEKLVEPDERNALVREVQEKARRLRERGPEPQGPPTDDDSVRSGVRTDTPIPQPPFWGAREIPVDLAEIYPHLDIHVLFKLHWGGKGVKGEEWRRLVEDDFQPRLERMWREQDYLHPRARLGYFPCNSEGNQLIVWDPEDPERELERLVFPRQPGYDRICLADFYRPLDSGERDVCAIQAVTIGDQATKRSLALHDAGEFAEQLFLHGLAVQAAEGTAEWLHGHVREQLDIPRHQGRRYSWGYGACPDQSEHAKVFRLLDAESIGLRLSEGFALEPEQSTLALVAHHPQAIYFGMNSGRLPADGVPDQVIAGSGRDGSLPDEDPTGEADSGEAELAGA